LNVTLKLINSTERRICLRVRTNADVGQRYGFGLEELDPKEAGSVSFKLLDGDFKRNDLFIIRTMYAPDFDFKNKDQWHNIWQEAIKLGLTTYNKLECVFEAKPEITPTSVMTSTPVVMPTPAATSTPVIMPTPAVTSTSVKTPTSAVRLTSVMTSTPIMTPISAVISTCHDTNTRCYINICYDANTCTNTYCDANTYCDVNTCNDTKPRALKEILFKKIPCLLAVWR
jgi:hypothetical protein